MTFLGYTRPDGQVGVRNHLLILSSVTCANSVARGVAAALPGAACITPAGGCAHLPDEAESVLNLLAGHGCNPNVGACLVVGLGCENISAHAIAERVAATGKPCEAIGIQQIGGTVKAIAEGVRIASAMQRDLSARQREQHDVAELIVGLECGGSDAASAISANPALGVASDRLVAAGGTAVLTEMGELIGAEHLLAKRAVSREVAERILEYVGAAEQLFLDRGFDIRNTNPSPGNKEGGLTTLEEKSLGAAHKAGTSPIVEAVGFGERRTKCGLVVMDGCCADVESVAGLVAGGAQIVVFTTGRGNPVGSPVAPVIKVVSNTPAFEHMRENIDVNAGTVLDGTHSLQEAGEELFREILAVADGRLTAAERLGCDEFALYRFQPTQ